MYGDYEVVAGWPKPLSSVPGWAMDVGRGQGLFAESRPRFVWSAGCAESAARAAKIARASNSRSAAASGAMPPPPTSRMLFKPRTEKTARAGEALDAVSRASIQVGPHHQRIDAGNQVEDWTSTTSVRRPHYVREPSIRRRKSGSWTTTALDLASARRQKLLQTIGTVNVPGETRHLSPAFRRGRRTGSWRGRLPNTRVVKFARTGKYLRRGASAAKRKEPGEATSQSARRRRDPQSGKVFGNDSGNRRIRSSTQGSQPSWSVGSAEESISMDGSRMMGLSIAPRPS